MKKNILFSILLIAAVLGSGLIFYQFAFYGQKTRYYGKPYHRQAPNFTLTDHDGERITLEQFKSKIVLIAWGYTNCPDVCPITLAKLKNVVEDLGDKSDQVQVLFLTVDPDRDTPDRLKSYVPFFNNGFVGVTGTQEKIEKIADEYGVTIVKHPAVYGRSEEDHWDRYLLTHTNTIYLVNRGGELLFTYPHYNAESEGIASDLQKLLH